MTQHDRWWLVYVGILLVAFIGTFLVSFNIIAATVAGCSTVLGVVHGTLLPRKDPQ